MPKSPFFLIIFLIIPFNIFYTTVSSIPTPNKAKASSKIFVSERYSYLAEKKLNINELISPTWKSLVSDFVSKGIYAITPSEKFGRYSALNTRSQLTAEISGTGLQLGLLNSNVGKLQLKVGGLYSEGHKIKSVENSTGEITGSNVIRFNSGDQVITEYVNTELGIRQNFIILKKPEKDIDEISMHLSVNGNWKVSKTDNKNLVFHYLAENVNKEVILYSGLKVFDAKYNELESAFSINGTQVEINVNIANAVFPVTIDPLASTPATVLSGSNALDYLGISVASAGDVNADGYSDVIVGAWGVNALQGAAYVYLGSSTGLSPLPVVTLNGLNAGDKFGYSVTGAGDVNGDGFCDVAIGAFGVSSSSGAVYVYYGSLAGVTSSPSNVLGGIFNGQFGQCVSSAGDVNADGFSDLIVGSRAAFSLQGAANLFLGSVSGFPPVPNIQLTGSVAGDFFGSSVASAGDINGDGYNDIIVGAQSALSVKGAAYLFKGNSTGVNITPIATLFGENINDSFGSSVSCAGDVNGDGYSDVIVGAPGVSSNKGSAYVFFGESTGLNSVASSVLNGVSSGDNFGVSVACAGDSDADGYSEVLVGADRVNSDVGSLYMYSGSISGVSGLPVSTIEGLVTGDHFGYAVNSAGDINGDGNSDVIIGAYGVSSNRGAAYIYNGKTASISAISPMTYNGLAPGDQFGISVGSAGDLNADGFIDVVVGANGVGADNGEAYIYLGSANGLSSSPALTLSGFNAGDQFGVSVSSAGDVNGDGYSDLVIGAFGSGGTAQGEVYIYYGGPAILSPSPPLILLDVDATNNDNFGLSVAGVGDVNGDGYSDIVVGACGANSYKGKAYLYLGGHSGLSVTPAVTLIGGAIGDYFGFSVSGAGDINGDGFSDLLVGAPTNSTGSGAAYLYLGGEGVFSTTPACSLHGISLNDGFGWNLSGCGDVNGDGFSDFVVGAYGVATNTGAAYIYYGNASVVFPSASVILNGFHTNDDFGHVVSSAGDVNGDGYSDLLIGSWAGGMNGRDGAYLYLGGSAGLALTPEVSFAPLTPAEVFGASGTGIGDVNSDGFSDILIGAYGAASIAGASYLYYGNKHPGVNNNLRLYNADLLTPIQQSNMADPNLFGAGLFAKSFLGRQKGKLVWETVRNGNPFSGNPITNSTAFTTQQVSYVDLGLNGTELKNQIAKMVPTKATYVRARVKFNPATAITGQVYGPWRYPEGFLRGRRDVGAVALPLKFIVFNALKADNTVQLRWKTDGENSTTRFEILHSTDGILFNPIGNVNASDFSGSEFSWIDYSPSKGKNFYRIKAQSDSKSYLSVVRFVQFNNATGISIFPNPVIAGSSITLQHLPQLQKILTVSIINSLGISIWHGEYRSPATGKLILNVPYISAGHYFIEVVGAGYKEIQKIVIVSDK